MKILFTCILNFWFVIAFGQSNDLIPIGIADTVHSELLNEERIILVHVPGKSDPLQADKNFPVVYVLDGERHFQTVVALMHEMSTATGDEKCPEMIVVGIKNKGKNRSRDLVPSSTIEDDKFAQFLQEELIPYVDTSYPTISFRTLIGHSIGGLRTINTAINQPDLFNAYVAIDPSLSYNNNTWFHKNITDSTLNTLNEEPIFIGMAHVMPAGMNLDELKTDTTGATLHSRKIYEFSQLMELESSNFGWKYYRDETHGSSPILSIYDGFEHLFSWFPIENLNSIFDDSTTPEQALNIINEHYENVSQRMGTKYLPPEAFIKQLAYYLFPKGLKEKAYAFVGMNLENYPNSCSAHEMMGTAYYYQGNKEKAIEMYEQALKIQEVPSIKGKLKRLTLEE